MHSCTLETPFLLLKRPVSALVLCPCYSLAPIWAVGAWAPCGKGPVVLGKHTHSPSIGGRCPTRKRSRLARWCTSASGDVLRFGPYGVTSGKHFLPATGATADARNMPHGRGRCLPQICMLRTPRDLWIPTPQVSFSPRCLSSELTLGAIRPPSVEVTKIAVGDESGFPDFRLLFRCALGP